MTSFRTFLSSNSEFQTVLLPKNARWTAQFGFPKRGGNRTVLCGACGRQSVKMCMGRVASRIECLYTEIWLSIDLLLMNTIISYRLWFPLVVVVRQLSFGRRGWKADWGGEAAAAQWDRGCLRIHGGT